MLLSNTSIISFLILFLLSLNVEDVFKNNTYIAISAAAAGISPSLPSQSHLSDGLCDLSQYNPTINSRSNEDFLPLYGKNAISSSIKSYDYPKLLAESQSLLKSSIVRIKEYNLAKRDSYLSVLLPKFSKCMWLSVSKPDRAGLGHSLFSWAYYLRIAQNLNMTYWSPFYSIAHDMCSDLVGNAKYFGFHPIFYWSRRPSSKNTTIINVYDSTNRRLCQEPDILLAMLEYLKHNPGHSCNAGNVLFQCNNDDVPLNSRLLYSLADVSIVLNTIFNISYYNYKANFYLNTKASSSVSKSSTNSPSPPSPFSASSIKGRSGAISIPPVYSPEFFNKDRKLFKMVVHMRRGDIIRSENIDIKHRVVSANVFLQVIKKVIESRSSLFPKQVNKRQERMPMPFLDISILCEDSIDTNHVSEFELLDTNINRNNANSYSATENAHKFITSGSVPRSQGKIISVDIKKELSGICNDESFCSVFVSHKLPFINSFSLMCESDILVSMKSGFSLTAASLCLPPLVIGNGLSTNNFDKFKYFVPIVSNGSFHSWRSIIELPNLHEHLSRIFLSEETLNRFKVKK